MAASRVPVGLPELTTARISVRGFYRAEQGESYVAGKSPTVITMPIGSLGYRGSKDAALLLFGAVLLSRE